MREIDRVRPAAAVIVVISGTYINDIVPRTTVYRIAAIAAGNRIAMIGTDQTVEVAERISAVTRCRPCRQIDSYPICRGREIDRIGADTAIKIMRTSRRSIEHIARRAAGDRIVAKAPRDRIAEV